LTFERCKLDFSERETHAPIYALHRDLLKLRREVPAFRQESSEAMHGSVIAEKALVLRFLCPEGDALLLTNLGPDLDLSPVPEPLLAPPSGVDFRLRWSSESPRYGGGGTWAPHRDGSWRLPAQSTLVFVASETEREESQS
jgi:maltooligosyltrehalose trehalohydrolase